MKKNEPSDSTAILKLLASFPAPSKLKRDDTRRAIVNAKLAELNTFPTVSLCKAVQSFADSHRGDLDELSKIFLLNRYVFDLPPREPKGVVNFHSWAIEANDTSYFARPLAPDSAGQLTFEGEFLFYIGPPYEPVREFDYFRKRFPRRRTTQ